MKINSSLTLRYQTPVFRALLAGLKEKYGDPDLAGLLAIGVLLSSHVPKMP